LRPEAHSTTCITSHGLSHHSTALADRMLQHANHNTARTRMFWAQAHLACRQALNVAHVRTATPPLPAVTGPLSLFPLVCTTTAAWIASHIPKCTFSNCKSVQCCKRYASSKLPDPPSRAHPQRPAPRLARSLFGLRFTAAAFLRSTTGLGLLMVRPKAALGPGDTAGALEPPRPAAAAALLPPPRRLGPLAAAAAAPVARGLAFALAGAGDMTSSGSLLSSCRHAGTGTCEWENE
jgi:hypothetical protein